MEIDYLRGDTPSVISEIFLLIDYLSVAFEWFVTVGGEMIGHVTDVGGGMIGHVTTARNNDIFMSKLIG